MLAQADLGHLHACSDQELEALTMRWGNVPGDVEC